MITLAVSDMVHRQVIQRYTEGRSSRLAGSKVSGKKRHWRPTDVWERMKGEGTGKKQRGLKRKWYKKEERR